VDHVDINPQVTSELRRHTDGVQTRQSVRAITNDNPGHSTSSLASHRAWRPPNALVQLQAILVQSTQPNDLAAPVCCDVC
jgi:hypothetical protein